MTFEHHFTKLKNKCKSKLNLIANLSSKKYNLNQKHLLTIYKSKILSLFQYSMVPLYVASKKTINSIQIIQNKVLRMILRTPFKTRISTLHKMANIEYIRERNENLIKNFLKRSEDNPTIQKVIDQHKLLNHNEYRAAHRSVIDQVSLL